MKWFHHECAAKHDPKLQTLGATYGAEGLGIYWGLLEEIGQHSDTFHLKITGISVETDNKFIEITDGNASASLLLNSGQVDISRIPRIPLKILARILFTSARKLGQVLNTCVEIGLFDIAKWREYHLLHSPSFEHRADDYTRRQQRKADAVRPDSVPRPDTLRTQSAHSPNIHRIQSAKVPPEQTTDKEAKEDSEQNNNSEEHVMLAVDAGGKIDLSTTSEQTGDSNGHYLIEPGSVELTEYSGRCLRLIQQWNQGRRNPFSWVPTESELRKLFCGGDVGHKLAMCYQAFNLQGDKINYPELVLRAVRLMLKASEKKRILNPFGWLWSCLHGNGDGTTPWVQLLTADEEKSGTPFRQRTLADTDLHPP